MCDKLKHYRASFSTKKVIHNSFSQGSVSTSHSSQPHHRTTPHASRLCNGRHALWQPLLTRGCLAHGMMSRSLHLPPPPPLKPRSERSWLPGKSTFSSPQPPSSSMPRPKTWYKAGTAWRKLRQNAWPRSPGCRSFPNQVPVKWWQSRWPSPSKRPTSNCLVR